MLVEDVLLKSFIIFFVATLMLTVLALFFIRAINKTSVEKTKIITVNLLGKKNMDNTTLWTEFKIEPSSGFKETNHGKLHKSRSLCNP